MIIRPGRAQAPLENLEPAKKRAPNLVVAPEFRRPGFLVCALILVVSGLGFIPWNPSVNEGTSEYFLHLAIAQGWALGRESVFTYGPLGFCAIPCYHDLTFWSLLTFHGALGVLGVVAMSEMWRLSAEISKTMCLWLAAMVGCVSLTPCPVWTGAFLMPYLLGLAQVVVLTAPGHSPRPWLLAATGLALGETLQVKYVFVPPCLLLWLVEAVFCLRLRRFPWSLAGGLAGFLAGTASPAFSWPDFSTALYGATEMARGYRDAMTLVLEGRDALAYGLALLPGLLLAVAFGIAWWSRDRWVAATLALFTGAIAGWIYLHGFIRAESDHSGHAVCGLLALCVLVAAPLWAESRALPKLSRIGVRGAWAVSLLCLVSIVTLLPTPRPAYGRVARNLQGAWALLTVGTRPLQELHAAHLAKLAKTVPPALQAARSAPVLTSNHSFAEVLPNPVRPYPTVTTYAAYTPYLAQVNARAVTGPLAPEWVMYSLELPDENYPTCHDNRMALALACGYSPVAVQDERAWFRKARPFTCRFETVLTAKLPFGQRVTGAARPGTPIWLHITPHLSFWGKVMGRLFRQPRMAILALCGDRLLDLKLPLEMAPDGFLLSPLVAKSAAVAAFCGNLRGELKVNLPEIREFSVKPADPAWLFAGPVDLRVVRVWVEPSTNSPAR